MNIEISIRLEILSFYVNGSDRRMMESLFEKNRDSSKNPLKGFAKDGVEGFLHIRKA
jgi:hypothetical protein